jgi:hypothetical protein
MLVFPEKYGHFSEIVFTEVFFDSLIFYRSISTFPLSRAGFFWASNSKSFTFFVLAVPLAPPDGKRQVDAASCRILE